MPNTLQNLTPQALADLTVRGLRVALFAADCDVSTEDDATKPEGTSTFSVWSDGHERRVFTVTVTEVTS